MKSGLFYFALILTFNFSNSQNTTVPDDQFELYLETHDADGNVVSLGDSNSLGDGIENNNTVPTSKIEVLTNLDISSFGIQNMTGIEDFAALENLNCSSNNQLTTVNLFSNTALSEIRCFNCNINDLTLPNNNDLTYLSCGNNNLPSIDVSSYPLLEYLAFSNNTADIGAVNLSANTNLTNLFIHNAGVSSLDISQSANLSLLWCYGNALTNLDISANTSLAQLICYDNGMNNLTTSMSPYNSLTYLDCGNNSLTNLDLSVMPNIEFLYCNNNNLNTIDASTNAALIELYANRNMANLILPTTKTTLQELSVWSMNLSSLNYSEYPNLTFLDIGINNFTSADISTLGNLEQFYVNNNLLTSLNIANGNNENLDWMWAQDNVGLACIQVDNLALATSKESPEWQRDMGADFSESCSLSIEDKNNFETAIYPNPTSNLVNVQINVEADYTISNVSGIKVETGRFLSGENTVDFQFLTSGIYFIDIKSDKEHFIKMIIRK